ncbi:MAG: GNAT family N-acetyltransferase [Thermogemmatispora sp.]|uniref:GNAT family N-acetyltransferase n=1 Tax=Thermogemmatispora sp. TaxID=1968838 RepID=UPI00262D0C7C|nr:GNAT family N-acetyltransferase [Thermogemmatispora sp.]MBX5457839.1 GNAT family N-acetyltransferase [Thermogemmatispora sp.]
MKALLHGLRLASPELADRQELLRLFAVCGYGLDDTDFGDELLLAAEESWLVKTCEGEPIAYADLRSQRVNQEIAGSVGLACLLRLLVHPDYRRRGLGTLLLRLVEEQASRLALTLFPQSRSVTHVPLLLWTPILLRRDQRGALLFLEREGYAPLTFGCRHWPQTEAEAGAGSPDLLALLPLPVRPCRPLLIYAKEIALSLPAVLSASCALGI